MTARKRPPSQNASRLTEEMVGQIGLNLQSGCSLIDAAVIVGISERTLRNYRTRGAAEAAAIDAGAKPNPDEALYLQCFQITTQRRTERKVRALTKLQDLINHEDPHVALKAVSFFLERGWPDEWGRRTRIAENETPEQPAETDPEKLRAEAFGILDELAEKRSRKTG